MSHNETFIRLPCGVSRCEAIKAFRLSQTAESLFSSPLVCHIMSPFTINYWLCHKYLQINFLYPGFLLHPRVESRLFYSFLRCLAWMSHFPLQRGKIIYHRYMLTRRYHNKWPESFRFFRCWKSPAVCIMNLLSGVP